MQNIAILPKSHRNSGSWLAHIRSETQPRLDTLPKCGWISALVSNAGSATSDRPRPNAASRSLRTGPQCFYTVSKPHYWVIKYNTSHTIC